MRHSILSLALTLVLAATVVPRPVLGAEQPVLRILNWADYLDPELVAEFGRRNGVRIEETYFDSDTERDRRLAASGGAGFDLLMVDAAQVRIYRDRGWIEEIGIGRVPGLDRMEPRWRQLADGTDTHAFPFAWGTVGIAYRADRVTPVPVSWRDLFSPARQLCGKVLTFSDARELVGVALKATGKSANSLEPADYTGAEELLQAQKPCVAQYESGGSDEDSPLLTGEAWLAMSYSSDGGLLSALDSQIRFVLPAEGGLLWVDYLTVASSSKHKPLAMAFLQFLGDPANAVRSAVFSQAATPNREARELLPAEMLDNPVIYPPKAALDRSEVITTSTPAVMALRNQIRARIVGQ